MKFFQKKKRLPLGKMSYIGMGQLPYFHFCNSVEKYHYTLEHCEKILEKK